ncbi:helix-turn-helix domain-containing protein [Konateibacter massiliensis]|uniref:helix-turn-helix domain-containing protein n=1 Tax=Konateibacter massiliensis TaxID=2002841 RepID=UPI000C149AE9|nr:helix-turn-helix transcriptional regulator [Konateibacter massiliensis]
MKEANQIIRELREDRDLRQADVAKIIGTSQQQYSRCENGNSYLQPQSLITLANFYDVSTDYLLGRTSYKKSMKSLNTTVVNDYTTGQLLSDVLALSLPARQAVIDYIELQKLSERVKKETFS